MEYNTSLYSLYIRAMTEGYNSDVILRVEIPSTSITYRAIKRNDLGIVAKLDQDVYPEDDNLASSDWLEEVYLKTGLQDFGLIFEKEGNLIGTLMLIPLSKEGWWDLTTGKITITQIDDKHIFNPERDQELYLHGYHIHDLRHEKEKLKRLLDRENEPPIAEFAFRAAGDMIKKKYEGHGVQGFSVLAVSDSGIGVARNFLGMRPALRGKAGYHTGEYMQYREDKLGIVSKSLRDRMGMLLTSIPSLTEKVINNRNSSIRAVEFSNPWTRIWETQFLVATRGKSNTDKSQRVFNFMDEAFD